MMSDKNCMNCKFVDRPPSGFICRRSSPLIMLRAEPGTYSPPLTIWPSVTDRDWCGEFEQKTNENTNEVTKEKEG